LQTPVLPHSPFGVQLPCGSALPAGTFAHVPGLWARLHAWQVEQAIVLQQTPSVAEVAAALVVAAARNT
jgi:hypothetical protein